MWVRESRLGLFSAALVIGVGAGLGALAFRWLVFGSTWLATGSTQFGQGGYGVLPAHFAWLGRASFLVIPVIAGLIYGPLVSKFAPEARGHGVPEVMAAVAFNKGRIRPRVALVKAVASAVTIGGGGSVGREGPIVQIGSAMASSLGQALNMPSKRLRIFVACGAAAGISATFNAPITGMFFGVEIILRAISAEVLFAVMLSSMAADAFIRLFIPNEPFLSGFPSGVQLHNPRNYLLIAVLAVIAALVGQFFSKMITAIEDVCDRLWQGSAWRRRLPDGTLAPDGEETTASTRGTGVKAWLAGPKPEWLRPVVGGVVTGLILIGLPQMYGVGYPVMYQAANGGYVLWFLVVLAIGKMIATSVSLGIGGSGGVFAPSLFVGLMTGMAFGVACNHLFGSGVGSPVLYAAVAMGAVFASATRAPLTALGSVVEMTGDFSLTLPIMLAAGIATVTSRALSYSTIYTAKLLRRGQDIDAYHVATVRPESP